MATTIATGPITAPAIQDCDEPPPAPNVGVCVGVDVELDVGAALDVGAVLDVGVVLDDVLKAAANVVVADIARLLSARSHIVFGNESLVYIRIAGMAR